MLGASRGQAASRTRRVWRVAALVIAVPTLLLTARPSQAAGPATVAPPGTLGFAIHVPPDGTPGKHSADEPSIGANWNSGAIMYLANTTVLRVTFDAAGNPTWANATGHLTSVTSFDPILFTDHATGRTFVSQLDLACSLSEFTDDDGLTWIPSQGCAQNGSEDHQSVGGGPFHAPFVTPVSPAYQHAVYYCNQDGGAIVAGGGTAAWCGLSVNGGLTYSTGIPIYSFAQCGGLHGHVRVAPDGTAVVPNQNCGPALDTNNLGGPFPNQAAVVSTNNGATWAVHVVTGSTMTLRSDPSVAFDANNRMYFGYEDGVFASGDVKTPQIGGRAMIATSPDNGATWSTPVDVGAPLGIQNVTFPEVIAGDNGRAAYAFLGSSTSGNPEDTSFQGFWYLYVAFTYDAGQTWVVQNLTPNDPVERNCIFLAGNGSCPSVKRNLLDFMDVTVDNHGRVLVGYADGCDGTCVTQQTTPCPDTICATGATASTDRLVSIARQTCGQGLNALFDSALSCTNVAAVPETPLVAGMIGAAAAAGAVVGWMRRRKRGLLTD